MKSAAATVEAYLAELPEDRRTVIEAVRRGDPPCAGAGVHRVRGVSPCGGGGREGEAWQGRGTPKARKHTKREHS